MSKSPANTCQDCAAYFTPQCPSKQVLVGDASEGHYSLFENTGCFIPRPAKIPPEDA